MNSLGILFLFILVIYFSLNYANTKFNVNKERIIVKEVALPTTFYDYFNQSPLTTSFAEMFGLKGDELNLINSKNDFDTDKETKDVFVPQRVFVYI